MKLSIFTIIYLFIRLAPMILFFYFIFQYILTYDINTLYFLIGLSISLLSVIALSHTKIIKKYQTTDLGNIVGEVCGTLVLTKNGALSILPLSQAMFGYILFFIVYILFKYNLAKQNIQYLILLPILIVFDMNWNTSNNCMNPQLLALSLTFGSAFGLLFAYIIDKSTVTDLTQFQRLDRTKEKCVFNKSTNKFTCYSGAKI
jgi:hypothetical protein